jgi:hypothetical protein
MATLLVGLIEVYSSILPPPSAPNIVVNSSANFITNNSTANITINIIPRAIPRARTSIPRARANTRDRAIP